MTTREQAEDNVRRWLASDRGIGALLGSTWTAQRASVTDDVLRRMVSTGKIPASVRDEWRQQYSQMIVNGMAPVWTASATAGGASIAQGGLIRGVTVSSALFKQEIAKWIDRHGASLIVELSATQRKAVKAILREFVGDRALSPRQLGRLIRPAVGMTERQARALARRYNQWIAEGISPSVVARRVDRYTAKLERVRSMRIARTELMSSFNNGALGKMRVEQTSLGAPDSSVSKEWLTADDERVCPLCGPLDNVVVKGLDTPFPGTDLLVPPRHPGCRCVSIYDVDVISA